MKKLVNFVKFLPLLFLGVAVVVWTSILQRNTNREHQDASGTQDTSPDGIIFPY